MDISTTTLEQLSSSIKVAKKLQSNANTMQKCANSDSSSESNFNSLDNTLDQSYSSQQSLTSQHSSLNLYNTTETEKKITSIEKLIDTMIIAEQISSNVRVDAVTQTMSTGDIVLSQVWNGEY